MQASIVTYSLECVLFLFVGVLYSGLLILCCGDYHYTILKDQLMVRPVQSSVKSISYSRGVVRSLLLIYLFCNLLNDSLIKFNWFDASVFKDGLLVYN